MHRRKLRGSLENRPKRKVGVPPNSLSSVSEIRGPRVPLFLTLDSFFLEMRKDKVCSEKRRTRALTRLSSNRKKEEKRALIKTHLQLLRILLSREGLTHPPAQGRVLERKTAQAVAPNGALALALHAKLSRWHAASSKR